MQIRLLLSSFYGQMLFLCTLFIYQAGKRCKVDSNWNLLKMWSKELSNVKALTYNNTNKQHKTLAWEYYKSTHFIVKGLRVLICTGWKVERRNKVQNLVPPNWLEKKHKLNLAFLHDETGWPDVHGRPQWEMMAWSFPWLGLMNADLVFPGSLKCPFVLFIKCCLHWSPLICSIAEINLFYPTDHFHVRRYFADRSWRWPTGGEVC